MSRIEEEREAAKRAAERQQQGAVILQGPRPNVAKVEYKAWSAPVPDPQIRLIIYAKKFYMMPQYSVLYDVFFDGAGESLALIFPHHRVKIYGRNLLDLAFSLRTNSVEWVKEYNAAFHELPPDDGTLPVIEEINLEQVDNPFASEMTGQGQV